MTETAGELMGATVSSWDGRVLMQTSWIVCYEQAPQMSIELAAHLFAHLPLSKPRPVHIFARQRFGRLRIADNDSNDDPETELEAATFDRSCRELAVAPRS